jgi:TonB family protein
MISVLVTPDPPLAGGEGMMVNIGYVDESTGDVQPTSEITSENPAIETVTPSSQPEVDEDIFTQENEEAVKINVSTTPPKDKVEVKTTVIDPKPEVVKEPVKTADPRALYKGKNSNSSSQGNSTQGSGDQGSRDGTPNAKNYGMSGTGNTPGSGGGGGGSSINLEGRKAMQVPAPEYNIQEEGTVVVEITVDKDGNVTNAKAGVKGSNTANAYLLDKAKRAALRTKFNADPTAREEQKGTIIYHFVLK